MQSWGELHQPCQNNRPSERKKKIIEELMEHHTYHGKVGVHGGQLHVDLLVHTNLRFCAVVLTNKLIQLDVGVAFSFSGHCILSQEVLKGKKMITISLQATVSCHWHTFSVLEWKES